MELSITLDAAGRVPLHRQLYDEVRRAIISGRLRRGSRIPSSRAIARSLGVSRSTVTMTFEHLLSEGYLEATVGRGTFVSGDLPIDVAPLVVAERPPPASGNIRLSTYGAALARTEPLETPLGSATIDFRDGRPAFDRFPYDVWRRLVARHIRADAGHFDYASDPAGHPGLREAIAVYLRRERALNVRGEDIVIVTGSQQAIDLIARLLVDPGDLVAIEDPGYIGAARTFAAHGAKVCGVPVDPDGIRVDRLERLGRDVRLAYVTPSHQFPTGSVLSLRRRFALLEWARAHRATIVEDDYDSAYRYEGHPIPALAGLDTEAAVVYVGTFSKTMFPALRIGYVVVPRALREVFTQAKSFADRQSPMLEQCALADFLSDGHFERHVRRMRALYRMRREAMLDALERHLGDAATVVGERAGMHVLVRLHEPLPPDLIERTRSAGVAVVSADCHYLNGGTSDEFIFGFARMETDAIEEGVRRFGNVLADFRREARRSA